MGKPGGADHQRQRDRGDVDHALLARHEGGRVLRQPQFPVQRVQRLEQENAGLLAFLNRAAEPELRNRIPGDLPGDGRGRDQKGDDENAVLGNLGIGDSPHAAKHGVEEDDDHANDHAPVDLDLQEPREHHADAAHLTGDVGEGDKDRAAGRHQPGGVGVVAVADELGGRELAVLAEVRGEQERQQDVAAGPAHQVDGAGVAHEGDEAGHRDERGSTHPVGARRHAVGYGRYAAAGDVEARGRPDATPPGDAHVEREGRGDDQVGPGLDVHRL